jgi:hypothetical protein
MEGPSAALAVRQSVNSHRDRLHIHVEEEWDAPKASLLLCYCYAGLNCSREISVASFGPFFAKECWQRKYRHNPESPIH